MKTKPTFFLMLAFYVLCHLYSNAQSTDSNSTSKSKKFRDDFNTMSVKYDTDSRLVKAKLVGFAPSLFGFGLFGFRSRYYTLGVEYEKKYDTSWSYLAGVETRYMQQLVIKGGIRYYYNIEDRIKKLGKPINFSANYFSAEMGYGYDFRNTTPSDDSINSSTIIELNLLFGLQRRLGAHAFIDLNGGPKISREGIHFVNIYLGAGFVF